MSMRDLGGDDDLDHEILGAEGGSRISYVFFQRRERELGSILSNIF